MQRRTPHKTFTTVHGRPVVPGSEWIVKRMWEDCRVAILGSLQYRPRLVGTRTRFNERQDPNPQRVATSAASVNTQLRGGREGHDQQDCGQCGEHNRKD